MLNSISRILTIFIKDLKESSMIIIIAMLLPLIGLFAPSLLSGDVKVCILSSTEDTSFMGFADNSIIYESSSEKAMKLLNNKKVDAVINPQTKEVVTYTTDPSVLGKIKSGLVSGSNESVNINIVNGQSSKIAYNAFLCTLLILMIGIAGNPVLFVSERKNDTMSALLLSPVSHVELIISKALSGFLSVIIAIFVFLFITDQQQNNFLGLTCLIIITALFTTVVAAIITLPFKTLEQMVVFTTPLSLIVVLAETLLYEMGKVDYLPIQSGFREILVYNRFPAIQVITLLILIIVLFITYIYFYKRVKRLQTN